MILNSGITKFQESGADGVTHLLSNMMNVKQSSSSGTTAISGENLKLKSPYGIHSALQLGV